MTNPVELDTDVRPQDDLYGSVNGAWLATAEIPPDLPMTGTFVNLVLEAEASVGEILRDSAERAASGAAEPGTAVQKIGDLFSSFLAVDHVNELGGKPLAEDLAAVDAVSSRSELAAVLGRLERGGVGGVVGAHVGTDDRQSDRYVVNLHQAGISLPDESYYREDGFADIREKFVAHVAAMLRLLGDSSADAQSAADRILALETRLASGHWDSVATRDVVKTYNLLTWTELLDAAPAFDWTAWREGLGASAEALSEVVVREPSYLSTLSEALVDISLDDWKLWMRWQIVTASAAYLSDDFVDENFDFYNRTLSGTQEVRERWKRGVALVNAWLGEAVGEQYVARHFPPEAKAQMDALVDNLVEAYRLSISELDWMSEQTRHRALTKLTLFRPKIGYPVRWRDYSALEIVPGDLVGNVRRAQAFETDRQLTKVGQPVDRDEWLMSPQTVNAYYNPGTNEICFPAAILRPPFFDPEADPALNYGGIGAVIGHEIGHGFDDQGSQYDGEGNLFNWWTDDDRAQFAERADALVEQYNSLEPRDLPGHHVNGALTLGENIGDLGGLTIGLKAYELSLRGAEAPVVDGLTGRQRVFVNWARCWQSKQHVELTKQRLQVDPHSPPEFRANIARNLDEFHDAFGTSPGDGMWLTPDARVRIW